MYNPIEYNLKYSETRGSLWSDSKDEATNFNNNNNNNNNANTNNFKSFKYKARLLKNTIAQPAPNAVNGILRIAKIAMPFKYLSTFCRSLKKSLLNCKVELKLRWKKYFVLSGGGTKHVINEDANANNIILTTKDKIICSYCNFTSERQSKIIKTSS